MLKQMHCVCAKSKNKQGKAASHTRCVCLLCYTTPWSLNVANDENTFTTLTMHMLHAEIKTANKTKKCTTEWRNTLTNMYAA